MDAVEQQYYAEGVGLFSKADYLLIESFFGNDGPTRSRTRVQYLCQDLSNPDQLSSLQGYIEPHKKFINGSSSVMELEQPFRDRWAYFQGGTNEILCEEYVRIHEMVDGQALISDRALADAIRLNSNNRYVTIPADSLTFYHSDGGFTNLPDALLLNVNEDCTQATLVMIYEFKSHMDALDKDGLGANAKIHEVKRTYRPGSLPCSVLIEATSHLLNIPQEAISFPDPKDLPLRLISSGRGIQIEDPDTLRVKLTGGVKSFNFPNIIGFSYVVLQELTARGLNHQCWQNYFTTVDDPNIASALITTTLARPGLNPKNHSRRSSSRNLGLAVV